VCLNLHFLLGAERNLLKINKKSSTVFEKKNEKDGKNFYKLKIKKLEKKHFHEICAQKVRFKMDQQQNGQCQKGPQ